MRGILVAASNRVGTRDVNIYAHNAAFPSSENIIGAETTHAGAILQLKTTSVYGGKADISQTLGQIILGQGVDLVNNNANGRGFTSLTSPSMMQFGVVGNFKSNVLAPYGYLLPGTLPTSAVPATISHIPFYKTTIVNGATFSSSIPFTGGDHTHINVFKYNSSYTQSTQMYAAEINATSTLLFVDGVSSFTFYTGDNLVVVLSTTVAGTEINGVQAKLYLY